MKASEILKKIAEMKSIYGIGASTYLNDPVLGPKFIHECYNEIKESKESMVKCFGQELVDEIECFVNKLDTYNH